MRSSTTRVGSALQNCSTVGAPKRCIPLANATIKRRIPYHAALPVDADRSVPQLPAALPSCSAASCVCDAATLLTIAAIDANHTGRAADPSRRFEGLIRGVETSRSPTPVCTSLHQPAPACTHFVIQDPELTGASNAPTPTRVDHIAFRRGTNPLQRLRQRQLSHCRGSRYETACHCCTAVSSRLRCPVRPCAACVLGDQTRPRGCTCCTRLSHSILTMLASARQAGRRIGPLLPEEAIRLSTAHLPSLVAGRYGSRSLARSLARSLSLM